MRKIKLIIYSLLILPVRIFSKISPLTLIRNSTVSNQSAILSGTRFYNSSIDKFSYIGRNCFVDHIKIGKFCSIADNCCIGLASHSTSWVSTSPVFHSGINVIKMNFANKSFETIKNTIIDNDVWIGMNSCILTGVHIATGAVVGAGAIVTKDVELYAIVGGNPAKLIRFRFDETTRENLLKSKWWDKSDNEIARLAEEIDDVERFLIENSKGD